MIWNADHAICLFLSLVSAGDAWLRSSWRGAGVSAVDPQRVLDALLQMVRQNLVIGAFLLSGIFLALAAGRVLMERWRRTLLRRGEARGRQAALDEVRMLAHAQLKAHVMATQRCLLQAQEAGELGEMRRWIDAGTAQVARLLQVAVGLHHAVSDSALPDDLEQTARDTVASLAVAYPHCTCTLDVYGPRPTAIDDTVQRAVVLMLYNALHNAYTHGKPSSVHVHLRYAPDALILIVRDDGNGGASTAHTGAGRGLRDMERLAARCGGALRIESVPMSGTVVTATMPLTIKGAPDDSLWLALAAPARRRAGRSAALAERGDRAALPCD